MRCIYCGAPDTEPDHLAGRDDRGRYPYPRLMWPSCPRCNKLGWRAWRAAGLARVGSGRPSLVYLRRIAVSLARAGDSGRRFVVVPVVTLVRLAEALADIADAIDSQDPR